jgi:glyoxylase-like metal-dependent hydrolase (beta-lactamase superfamily II)
MLLTTGCATSRILSTDPVPVSLIKLTISNAYLIKSRRPILIDAGSHMDMPRLKRGLAEQGLQPDDLALLVLTHGHGDHAGLARELQDIYHVSIALGAGDVPMAHDGHNDPLKPTRLSAALLKPFVDLRYDPFIPDFPIEKTMDLRPYGIAGRIIAMPGHTPGAVVVLLDDHRAFVGDQMLGGWLGGVFRAETPCEHYFQADVQANRRNIRTLLGQGVKTFYLGHGGPVAAADVVRELGL